MKSILFLAFLSISADAEIIRLSLVAPEATSGYTRHEYDEGEEKQAVFVEEKGFLTEADIAIATPSPTRADSVDVTLSAQGTEKMIAATTPMRPGIDRIAILVDGKVISSPVVQSVPLGKNFVISGLNGEAEPVRLAARLTGKTEAEIHRELAEREAHKKKFPTPESTHLIIKNPAGDMAAGNANYITIVEGMEISLKAGKKAPTDEDYFQLASALHGVASAFPKSQGIQSQCDMITILSKEIPELALLKEKSKGKRIPFPALTIVLEAYIQSKNTSD